MKVKNINKDIKKRGYRILERMFGTVEQQRAKDKAWKQDFVNGMKAGAKSNNNR